MRFVSALSRRATTDEAVAEVVATLVEGLAGQAPTVLFLFSTPHHGLAWDGLSEVLRRHLGAVPVVGSSGRGIIGGGHEVEDGPALSVTAAVLPDTEVRAFVLPEALTSLPGGPSPAQVRALVGVDPDAGAALLVWAEPYSCHLDPLLRSLDAAYPHGPVIGGVASGGQERGHHVLFGGQGAVRSGMVGVAIWGGVQVEALVAQGCRPVGPPRHITRAQGGMVLELEGQTALQVLEGTWKALDEGTRRRFQRAPLLGVAMDPGLATLRRGDFLIRQLVGVDPPRGGFSVSHLVATGDVLQLHVRDAVSSGDDIHELAARSARAHGPAHGALMFSCLGRGRGLYGTEDFDSRALASQLGDFALGGFFCNGEIGPVHGRTYLHAFTSAVALFRPASWN